MGLLSKLKDIIFDEVTVEIPVITKENEESYEKKKIKEKDDSDDVVITKIESKPNTTDDMFDMPKLRENDPLPARRTSSFTFPIFDDDEDEDFIEEPKEIPKREEKRDSRTNKGYDYLSSSTFKADSYTQSRNNQYDKDSKKPFTLSPIISPVYGILNENYKKEDIVAKDSSNMQYKNSSHDLDAVRKKAYGTLEDEIEDKLVESRADVLDEVSEKKDYTLETLSDDGLSVNDLLIDDDDEMNEEVFDIGTKKIDVSEEVEINEEKDSNSSDTIKMPDSIDNDSDDLFDLIDSLYEGKDEKE